jgi:parvulin-like peptidyl-prolyl isomerase
VSPSKRKRPTSGRKSPPSGKAGSKGSGKRPPDREAVRRFGLLVFGLGLVALFAIVAISEGIGHPSVPSGDVALVEDVPDGAGEISEADFRLRMEQTAAKSQLKKVPKPGDPQYKEIRETALGELIQGAWIKGQAAEMGISVTDQEVSKKVAELKEQSFASEAEYRKTIKDLRFTEADVRDLMEFELLIAKIQEEAREGSPKPSESEIEGYYEEVKATQFTQAASRDVRLILNKDQKEVERAKALLEKDSSPQSWRAVAKKYSTESRSKKQGGLRRGLKEGDLDEPLDAMVFSTPEDELEGPVKTPQGFYLFEVESSTPESVQSLDDVRDQVETLVGQQLEDAAFQEFGLNFEQTWRVRTFCASGFTIKLCSNLEESSDPAAADPTSENCRKDVSPKDLPEACPAPVVQRSPALPGTVSLQARGGTGSSLSALSGTPPLAQRPRPAGLEEAGEKEVPVGLPPNFQVTP